MESTDVTFFSRADVTLFSRANKTLASNSNNTDNKITIIIPTSVVLVLGVVCFVVVVIVKRRKVNCKGNCQKSYFKHNTQTSIYFNL